MSTYVMSDIHGEYQTFLNMLDQIHFSETDDLYIIGDVVDRGPEPMSLINYTRRNENVHLLKGNHEHMMCEFFSNNCTPQKTRRWNRNGNFTTLVAFDWLSDDEKSEVLSYIDNLPVEKELEVNGRKFHLVHGFIADNDSDRVWNRPKIDQIPQIDEDTTLVIGHTPVVDYIHPGSEEDMYVYSKELTTNNDHFRILHAKGFIDIDCCIGYGFSAARLACLRLDDMAEFYEKVVIEEK